MTRDDIAVVIPSHKRPQKAAKVLRERLPFATVCVGESEEADYLAAGVPPAQLKLHPDLHGLARIRNWIVQHNEAPCVVQVDDDFIEIRVWPGVHRRIITEPERLFEVIYSTALAASEAGVRLFGWGNVGKPLYFRPHDPFNFIGPVGRALGTLGKDVSWDERLVTMVDTDVTLQELKTNRIVLLDTRYYWYCGAIYGEKGGMQSVRTKELREADLRLMKDKWGGAFDCDGKSKSGQSKNAVKVERRQGYVKV